MPGTDPRVQKVERSLSVLRALARGMLVAGSASLLLAIVLGLVVVLGGVDYIVRAPTAMRITIWVLGVAGIATLAGRWLVPALRFRPPLTEFALRLERSHAPLAGTLASSLDLARDPERERSPVTRFLADQVIARGEAGFRAVRMGRALAWKPLGRRGVLLGLAALVSAGVWVASPELAGIGARRIVTPWAGAEWPKRTGVADATAEGVHPLGREIEFRALLTRTDRPMGQTRVAVRYRLVAGSQGGEVKRALLTGQEREEAESGARGELYTRLINPAGAGAGDDLSVEYWFETQDDRTPVRTLRLVEPPRVARISATITPPEYTGAMNDPALFLRGSVDLGTGEDERAVVGPILAGSRVEVRVEMTKPVETPSGVTLARFLPEVAASAGEILAGFEPTAWTMEFTATEPLKLTFQAQDEHGLETTGNASAGFEVIRDREPTAVVSDPPEDEFVLPGATIPVMGEGRDDLGLASVSLDTQTARPPKGSIGAPAEATGNAAEFARVTGAGEKSAAVSHVLELGGLSLSPGDEVWIHAIAADSFVGATGPRDPTRSPRRRLRVIGPDQFVEQVQAELSLVRQGAIRADEAQAGLESRLARGESEVAREQASLTERLAAQARALDRLARRADRNNLDDPMLEELLEDARASMSGAGAASDRATRAMREESPEGREEARQAQGEVRSELARVIDMLDRGQDNWAVRRELQRLSQEQRALTEQTARAGEATAGRTREELTQGERATLDELAARQEELAERAAGLLGEMRDRAQRLRENDPAQAAGLEQAAQRGERERIEERMEAAAENLSENRAANAGQEQEAAQQALQAMLEDLDAQARNRDEALRRIMASLLQSLDSLITEQEDRLRDLARARADDNPAGLDAGMIRLHQNTLGVLLSTRTGLREMEALARLVEEAARAQGTAIEVLRLENPDLDAAERAESESLTRLRQARAEAQRLDDEAAQRDADRKRRELRRLYRDALEQQVVLRGEAEGYIGQELDRRTRREVARLGERQRSLQARLAEVREQTEEMRDARIFSLAHDRLDTLSDAAAKAMTSGRADDGVRRRLNSLVSILQGLVEALAEDDRQDEFREEEGGEGEAGGSGQGGQQGQEPLFPPIAELRLLRALQHEAMELTRALDEARSPDASDLHSLGELQKELYERGKTLIDSLQRPAEEPGT